MFLFDTDVITNVLKKRPAPSLLERLASVPMSQQHISTVTVAEIVYGAMKSNRPEYHLNNLEQILLPSANVVGFDTKAATFAELEGKEGNARLDLADLEIASTAIAGDFTREQGTCGISAELRI
jgi:tRNA(fMet)-specific endonuclease VapC